MDILSAIAIEDFLDSAEEAGSSPDFGQLNNWFEAVDIRRVLAS